MRGCARKNLPKSTVVQDFGNRIVAEVWQRYEKTLAAEKALDFDDLIALPVRLLEEHDDIRALVQNRWQYIHIDEYQDTNGLQERLAGLLAEKHKNLFVVGDGDQAIYGWRGAKMENILHFEKDIRRRRRLLWSATIVRRRIWWTRRTP